MARRATVALLFVLAAALGAMSGLLFASAGDLPQISALDDYSPSTITRLVDMGVERFLVASSLVAVLAQRLVRVLCTQCRETAEATVEELVRVTGEGPRVNQIRWGPALYDPGVVDEHRRRNVVLEGYSPFKSTDLDHPVLAGVARRHGVTTAQVVVRWHVEHGFVVIPKSATPERIAANLDVFGFALDEEDVHAVDGLARARRR